MPGGDFMPAGIVTLLTDFGLADPFVGIVKGRILGRFPAARIVDLSHAIPAGHAGLAGFWLARAWREFPPGTLHLAVVDPGVGTDRGVVLAGAGNQLLLAPDNGLLPEALRGVREVEWRRMNPELPAHLGLLPLSATFHGRDLFAPLAAELACGALSVEDFGPPATPEQGELLAPPQRGAGQVTGCVVLVDHFGNLITNIPDAWIAKLRQPTVTVAGRQLPLMARYSDTREGAPLALINAFGLLEVAVNRGRAEEFFAIGAGSPIQVRAGLGT
jgi:S-adenosyl-L-methionine hydrolase (adenosine-forming)